MNASSADILGRLLARVFAVAMLLCFVMAPMVLLPLHSGWIIRTAFLVGSAAFWLPRFFRTWRSIDNPKLLVQKHPGVFRMQCAKHAKR